jgi:hypothetical protein
MNLATAKARSSTGRCGTGLPNAVNQPLQASVHMVGLLLELGVK